MILSSKPRKEYTLSMQFPAPGRVINTEVRLKAQRVLKAMSTDARRVWEEAMEEVNEDALGEGVVLSTQAFKGKFDPDDEVWLGPAELNLDRYMCEEGMGVLTLIEYAIAGTVTRCEVTTCRQFGEVVHRMVIGEIVMGGTPTSATSPGLPRGAV
ncbi:hypothetical protein [Streptomyces lydicus]|uniref:hypothetical protein n=3 Tax=Streptomyces lydicus TaxID=47763 RepID=UPI00052553D5|nr:hypothetical protein [Streptomyces lydicus]MDC7335221.1 hypothetical protein [Streptomyces lydicus]